MSGAEKLRRKQKTFEPAAPKAEQAPCTTCGPGKIRASHFPSLFRATEVREGGSPTFDEDAMQALVDIAGSPQWLMLEDLVERVRDERLLDAMNATSVEVATASAFRAQGVEIVLRALRTIRATKEAKNAPADV